MARLWIIGHPLAAAENREPFRSFSRLAPMLLGPGQWHSRSAGRLYSADTDPEGALPLTTRLNTLAGGHNAVFLWRGLESALAQARPGDAVYCWNEPWAWSSWQVFRWARSRRLPFFGFSAENRRKRLPFPSHLWTWRLLSGARGIVAPNAEVPARLAALGYRGNCGIHPLGIREFPPLQPDFTRREIAYVGRLIRLKGVHRLLEALAIAPDWRLKVVGEGPERSALEAQAKRLGIRHRVAFLGACDNAGLPTLLSGVSALILPTLKNRSQAEQFGKAAHEAAVLGIPVIVSDSGHLAEFRSRYPATVFGTGTEPAALAASIHRLLSSPPTSASLAATRAAVLAEAGSSASGRRLESWFLECLEKASAPKGKA